MELKLKILEKADHYLYGNVAHRDGLLLMLDYDQLPIIFKDGEDVFITTQQR